MANEQNLKPFVKGEISSEEAARRGRKGGIESGKRRRERKALAQSLNDLLARSYTSSDGQTMNGTDLISAKLFQKAMDGDTKAFLVIRDTVGEMPVQKIETVTIAPETYQRVQTILDGFEAPDDTGVQPDER